MARQRPATHDVRSCRTCTGGGIVHDDIRADGDVECPDCKGTGKEPVPFSRLVLHPERLEQPLHWTKPRVVFVVSRGDLLHDQVPAEYILRVWDVMERSPQHQFLVLTKRPRRLRDVLGGSSGAGLSAPPLPNVWLGVSVTGPDDRWRIEELCRTPAAYRFVSYEPALADLGDVSQYLGEGKVEWVVVGAESGAKRRPCERAWWSNVLKSCRAAGIPGYLKQRPELMGIKNTTNGDHILDCSGKLLHFPPTAADIPPEIWRVLEGKR